MSVDGNILSLHLTWNTDAQPVQPGQTVYLRVPAISYIFTHPFSVAGITVKDDITHVILHIRIVGDWTKRLKQKLGAGNILRVQVEGPYESRLDYLSSAPAVVLIAGGTGVTPVLGLLRHYVNMAISGSTKVPEVHFLWTSRHLAELRLLGSELLAAAKQTDSTVSTKSTSTSQRTLSENDISSGHNSAVSNTKEHTASAWLHASLYYTGLELEIEASKAKLQDVAHMDSNEVSMSFMSYPSLHELPKPAGCKVQPDNSNKAAPALVAHPTRSTWLHAATTVLAFTGAFAGFLCANYYTARGYREREGGFNYGTIGILQFVGIAVGIVLPVIVLLAIVRIVGRCYNNQNSSQQAADTQADAEEANCTTAASISYLHPDLMVLPDYSLCPAGGYAGTDSLQLKRGRPDTAALLRFVRERYVHLRQVDVVVAGPDGLCQAVQELCQKHVANGPELICHRAAYHT